jgi:two-component system phosphate regulon response regulator OmpR
MNKPQPRIGAPEAQGPVSAESQPAAGTTITQQTGAGSSATRHLLVVDDDQRLRDLLQRYLTQQGFEVSVADSGAALNRQLHRRLWDLIVLDIMMPGEDGLSIIRRLRSAGEQVPIILLTARAEDVDRIIGREMGADDYLPKPFNPRELLARIHAVLRRQPSRELAAAPALDDSRFRFGDFEFDPAHRRLLRNGEPVELTTGEFALLKVLTAHARQPLNRDKLMLLTRGREYGAYDRSLDVQVSRLRKLIEHDPAHPRHLQTVWGVGYVFVPD